MQALLLLAPRASNASRSTQAGNQANQSNTLQQPQSSVWRFTNDGLSGVASNLTTYHDALPWRGSNIGSSLPGVR